MTYDTESRASEAATWAFQHGFQDTLTAQNLRAVAAKLTLSSSSFSPVAHADQSQAFPTPTFTRESPSPHSISTLRVKTDSEPQDTQHQPTASSWSKQIPEKPVPSTSPCVTSSQSVSPAAPPLVPHSTSKSPSASPVPPTSPIPLNLGPQGINPPPQNPMLRRHVSEGSGSPGYGSNSPALRKLPSRLSKAEALPRGADSPGVTSAAAGKSEGPSWKRLEPWQIDFLEQCFCAGEVEVDRERREQLAAQLRVKPRQVAVWFQNRRGRWNLENRESEVSQLRAALSALQLKYDALEQCHNALASQVPSSWHSPECPSSPSSLCCTSTPPSNTPVATPNPPPLSLGPSLTPSLLPTRLFLGPPQNSHTPPPSAMAVCNSPPAPPQAWAGSQQCPPAPNNQWGMSSPSPQQSSPPSPSLQQPQSPAAAEASPTGTPIQGTPQTPHPPFENAQGQSPAQETEAKQEVRQKLAATLQLISAILTQSVTQSVTQAEQQRLNQGPAVHAPTQAPQMIQEPKAQKSKRVLEDSADALELCHRKPAKIQCMEPWGQVSDGSCPHSTQQHQPISHPPRNPPSLAASMALSAQSTGSSFSPEHSTAEGPTLPCEATQPDEGAEKPPAQQSTEGGASNAPSAGMNEVLKMEESEMLPPPLIIPRAKPPRCPSTKKLEAGALPVPSPLRAFTDELHNFCLSPSFPWIPAPNTPASPSVLSPSGSRVRVRGLTSPVPFAGQTVLKREGNPWHFVQAMSPRLREGAGDDGSGFLSLQASKSSKGQEECSGGLSDPGPVVDLALSQVLWE